MHVTFPTPMVTIYTDGSYRDKTKKGGWAAYLECGIHHLMIGDSSTHTTNNRMELMAVIEALRLLQRQCIVTIYSDSQYVLNSLNKWLMAYHTGEEIPPYIANYDLIHEMIMLARYHSIRTQWVKGHSDNPWNILCDAHAQHYSSL